MSIFKKLKLKLSRDRPKDEYINSAMFFFGRTTTGKEVNENSAMQLTSIYACVRILSESVVCYATIDLWQKSIKKESQLI